MPTNYRLSTCQLTPTRARHRYDELARFQENLAGLDQPVASGSLEFAVLVTGFVVQTLSHELLVQDVSAGGASVVGG